jgi:hypothetical protein
MKTSRLTEYEIFKKVILEMEKNPEIHFARIGEYVIVPSKIWDAGVSRIQEYQLAKMAVNSGRVN